HCTYLIQVILVEQHILLDSAACREGQLYPRTARRLSSRSEPISLLHLYNIEDPCGTRACDRWTRSKHLRDQGSSNPSKSSCESAASRPYVQDGRSRRW